MDDSGFSVVVDRASFAHQTTHVESRFPDKMDSHTIEPLSDVMSCAVCKEQFNSQQALSLHYFKKHEVRSVADIKQLESSKTGSNTASGKSRISVPAHSGKSKFCCSSRNIQINTATLMDTWKHGLVTTE